MIGPRRYFLYLAQRTMAGVLGLFAVIWLLVVAIDLIEAMREVGKVEGAGFLDALKMTLYRTPQLILIFSPFVFLFGTLWAFGQMSKTSEIAVMRSAGLSVWRLVAAPVTLSLIAGIITVVAIDPLASSMAGRAQAIKNEIRGRDANMIEAFRNGIWLRQTDDTFATIIHANSYAPAEQTLHQVTVWRRTIDGVFVERWDADRADVTSEAFSLRQARRTTLHGEEEMVRPTEIVPVQIDLRALREDVAKPTSLSVWQLSEFTDIMSSAGMPTTEYSLRYHDLWSLPIKLAAMALIACAVALGMNARAGGTAVLLGVGVAAGFVLFIVSELSSAVAQARIVPIGLAAWAPGILALMLATTLLLYREDG